MFQRLCKAWQEDHLLRGIIKNSTLLFSGTTLSSILVFVQGLVVAASLGVKSYGMWGVISAFVSNINRFLSFRMNELVVRYGGKYLEEGETDKAIGIIKAAGVLETGTSIFAYLILLLFSPQLMRLFKAEYATRNWIILFGLFILANFVAETSQAVLQLARNYKPQAILTTLQNAIILVWVIGVAVFKGSMFDVILAYLAGKSFYGLGMAFYGLRSLSGLLGKDWAGKPFGWVFRQKNILTFLVSTNLSQTATMVFRDSEPMWVNYFFGPGSAGLYKFANAVMGVVTQPITALVQTSFPEIARSIAQKAWSKTRTLLSRISLVAVGITAVVAIGMAVFGKWLLTTYNDGEYLAALPIAWILLIGYGFANIFFWNRSVLLAFGKPNYALMANLAGGGLKILLTFLLAKVSGPNIMPWMLNVYFIVSVGLIVWEGLRTLRKHELAEPEPAA